MIEAAEGIRKQFAEALRDALTIHFGKLPAASIVAREFNLRAYGVEAISQESARRWLRGLSMPSQDKLGVLQSWLSLDLNLILRSQSGPKHRLTNRAPPEERKESVDRTSSGASSDDGGLPRGMLQMLDRLSNSERVLIMDLMGLLVSRSNSTTKPPIRVKPPGPNGATTSTSPLSPKPSGSAPD